jgi:predicted ATP-grasp superfamily ATP-dependent carboligase
MRPLNILITDGQWRKALATVRSLGRKGHYVTVSGDSRLTTSFFSKYCNKRVVLPHPGKEKDIFIHSLLKLIKENKYDILIPLEDETIEVCSEYRNEIEKHTILPLPEQSMIQLFRDKSQTFKLAERFNIPHPRTYDFRNIDEFLKNYKDLEAPLIIKPRKSSGSLGLVRVKNNSEIYSSYLKVHSEFSCPIVQEYIADGGVTRGVSVLFDYNHELVGSFVHERIREFPVEGGPSTLRKSVIDKDLVNLSVEFLKKINWIGFAMLEFKQDPKDGIFKLIEVNPRFVGSIQLAISAGIDFPNLLVDAFVYKKNHKKTEYKENVYCRWLLPGDILHFINNKERFRLNPGFFKFFDENLFYDICDSDDPMPVLGRIIVMLKEAFHPDSWKKYIFRKV